MAASVPSPSSKRRPAKAPLLLLLLLAGSTVSLLAFSHPWLLSNSSPPLSSKIPALNSFPITPELSFNSSQPSFSCNASLLSSSSQPKPLQLNSTPHAAALEVEMLASMAPINDGYPGDSQRQGPYHNWKLFSIDFQDMLQTLKIFIYPDVSNKSAPFSSIFLPHSTPFHPKLGNYFSEHMFKINLLRSSFITSKPEEAHFFFMPFSINAMRNDPRLHSESSISDFVALYTTKISRKFEFWNASRGSDHFYVCCHSIGRDAASKHRELFNNAVQVTCSSSYFQRLYVAHKDVGLPQVWPRSPEKTLNPPDARLVFYAGRAKNSLVRQELIATWANDTTMDIFSSNPPFPYEEGFRRSRYCLHVKGYEVNTARISDALHYGCIPVIVSNHYDLPFANVLDWSKFSIIVGHGDIPLLKQILLSISRQMYLNMYENLCKVRKHFRWHMSPRGYDSFHMTIYQLWMRRGMQFTS
ncbi:probable glycosyltransferase At5g03795 isoform X2 [Magnolia sinica]|uniref:probable glycosyltransferase At5g03795 isoform X2 n=1 Tax=Magnolia sinica TaxID=86752 RepID=UPI0026587C83|nr:probable glycosyltransferase At5g03795 isoform X2 [Magnolia sinica]